MPVTKSALKKLRQDRKREAYNKEFLQRIKEARRKAKKTSSDTTVRSAVSLLDKAVKKHIMHKNKAARMKATLARGIKHKRPQAKKTKKTS